MCNGLVGMHGGIVVEICFEDFIVLGISTRANQEYRLCIVSFISRIFSFWLDCTQ